MDNTIDTLQIEIQAKGAESASGIDALTTSLAALEKMVNKTLTNKLGELSAALDKIKAPITVNMNVKGVEQLKGAVKSATSSVPAGAITPTVDGTAVSGELDKISGSAAQAAGELEQLVSPASKAKSELDGAGKTAQGTAADMDMLREEAAKLGYTLENVKGLNELRKTAKDAGFALRKVSGRTKLLTVDGSAVSGELDKISGSAAQAAGELEQLVSPATEVAIELRATGKSAGDAEKKLKEVGKSAKQGASGLSKFVSSLKRILMYRVVRSILSNIANAAKEGIQNLALYSKAIGGIDASKANATMSQFASIGMHVKNVLGSALLPVLNALMPVIQTLANWFIAAANAVNQFFAAISGASTWSKAKEYAVDYADGLNKASGAAKDLKKQLLPFDELNILQDNGTSGGGGAGALDYGNMFEEDGINEKIQNFADKIKPVLEWVRENFKTIAIVVGVIGGLLLAWKIGKGVLGLFSLFGGFFGKGGSGNSSIGVPSPKSVLTGLLDIAIIIGGLTAIVVAIGLLMKIPDFKEVIGDGIKSIGIVFNGLWDVILPLTAVSVGIVALGKIGIKSVLGGLAGFASIIGGTSLLIVAIGALMSIPYFSDFLSVGIQSVKDAFNGLWEVALPIGATAALIVGLGFATPAVVLSGLAGFALIIGGVELVLVALGALSQIPGFTWIVGEGGKALIKLGEVLGGFAGSIVDSFLEKVSDSFPNIGTNLAAFMTNAEPFFKGLDNVNASTLTSVGYLTGCILALTVADVIDGLTAWFTGGNSLTKFGEQLNEFAPHFVAYSKAIKGVDGNAVKNSSTAAKALAEFANNIPNSGGVSAWFAGENDIDVWGAKLPSFGKNFKKYSDNIKGVDGDTIATTSTAAKSMVEFAKNIPNSGGIAAWFAGDNNIDVWGAKLPSFGKNFKKYSDNIKGVDSGTITTTSTAAKSIVEFAKNIPNSGGIAAWFAGNNDIDVWGQKLPAFGKSFKAYGDNIKGLDANAVKNSAIAAESIVKIAENIPNSGGVAAWFAGDNTIDKFGKRLAAFGAEFEKYYGYIKNMSAETLKNITRGINAIIDFAVRIKNEVDNGAIDKFSRSLSSLGDTINNLPSVKNVGVNIVSSGQVQQKYTAFASGGYPVTGQMFLARESGPEMVGTIGNRTAVANNDQIVEGIREGVISAIRETQNSENSSFDIKVYLDGKQITAAIEKRQRERGATIYPGGVLYGV